MRSLLDHINEYVLCHVRCKVLPDDWSTFVCSIQDGESSPKTL